MATIKKFFPAACTMIAWSSRRGDHPMADSTTNPICWCAMSRTQRRETEIDTCGG
jgi:hypothetical protein